MKRYLPLILLLAVPFIASAQATDPLQPDASAPKEIQGFELKWNDEFNNEGKPNPANWKYENGFVRNEELQWYQPANVNCTGGVLLIEGKREQVLNPNYDPNSTDWKKNRQYATFTSGSIISQGLQQFQFGRFEIRARIDTTKGSWPAIWTKGISGKWPFCGETDIMEFYRSSNTPIILANVAWGSATSSIGTWDTKKVALSYFTGKDRDWCKKFHVWRMDWNKDSIRLYLDNELLNYTLVSQTVNPSGYDPANPHLQKHFFLLNLAVGSNGGVPLPSTNYLKYEVDYIRVYQPATSGITPVEHEMGKIFFYNQTLDELTVTSELAPDMIRIIDMTGRVILTVKTAEKKYSLSALKRGVYLVQGIWNNGKQGAFRFVK